MFQQFMDAWNGRSDGSSRNSHKKTRRPRLSYRPEIELMEERVVPVTEMYFSNPNLSIPDNNTTGAQDKIVVSTSAITNVIDVDVFIRIDHTWQGDVSLALSDGTNSSIVIDRVNTPNNANFGYAEDNFGSGAGANITYLVIDDQAAVGIHFYNGTGVGINNITGTFKSDNDPNGFFADTTSTLDKLNGGSGNRTWTLTARDHFGGDTGTVISWGIRITGNDPPSNLVIDPATGDEGSSINLTGKFDDPQTFQKHKVEIDWGDGSAITTLNLAAGVTTFSAPHTYADDDPTGTPSDNYNVTVTVTDDGGDSVMGNGTVTINNVAPSNVVVTPNKAAVNEGEILTLSGSFTDPGTLDTHTVLIDWGDGSPVEMINLAAGVTSFSGITHAVGDDNPAGTSSDNVTITVTVMDDDTGSAMGSSVVSITNVAPSALTLDQATYTINEGGTATVMGTFTDPGLLDPHLVHIDWDGDGTFDQSVGLAPGKTSFSVVSPVFPDDTTVSIKIRVDDDDLGMSNVATATIEVKNVAPSNIVLSGADVLEGSAAKISGSFDDPGLLDTHTVEIDWDNNGTFDQTLNLAAGVTTFSATGPVFADDNPTGTPFDPANIRIRVTDKDAGSATATTALKIINVAPTFVSGSLSKTSINENESVDLTINFADPGLDDTHTVSIDWEGDGVFDETFTLAKGDRSFTKTHTYLDDTPTATPQDTYFIKYRITDDDTGQLDATVSVGVTVKNVAPSAVTLMGPFTISENGTVTLSGSFVDPGTLDTHTVTINWGDGSAATVLNLSAGVLSFSGITHKYLDDAPSGTSSDNFTISVTVTDDDTGSAMGSTTTTVNNVAPGNLVLNGPFTINENDSILLTGTFTDPGTLDTHTVEIDWDGDGVYDQTINLAAGVLNFSVMHQYLDDLPTGSASDTNNINVRVSDDDLGEVTGSTAVTVNNVNPGTVTVNGPFTINENGVVTLIGSFVDPGTLDSHTVQIDWDGDGTFDQTLNLAVGARTFIATRQYLDDEPTGTPSDTNDIKILVTDDDTGTGEAATSVTINNLPPAVFITGAKNAVVGVPMKFTIDFADVGTLDTHEYSIDWGDGSPVDPFQAATSPFDLIHSFTAQGNFTISLSVRDDDTGLTTVTQNIKVGPVGVGVDICDPNDFSQKSLYVSGTKRNDVITFVPNLRGGVSVIVNGRVYGPFFPNSHVIAFGQGGNDRISVHPRLVFPAIFYGGDGNDVLVGSKADDLLFGEAGNDTMIGGHGRDVLIGGFGSDVLYGHYVVTKPSGRDDQDLLIGNATVFDSTAPDTCSILAEWSRTDLTFEERRERLRVGAGGLPALDLNNILEDNVKDRLFSVRSTDWLFQDAAGLDRFFGPIATQLS